MPDLGFIQGIITNRGLSSRSEYKFMCAEFPINLPTDLIYKLYTQRLLNSLSILHFRLNSSFGFLMSCYDAERLLVALCLPCRAATCSIATSASTLIKVIKDPRVLYLT